MLGLFLNAVAVCLIVVYSGKAMDIDMPQTGKVSTLVLSADSVVCKIANKNFSTCCFMLHAQ